MNNEFMKVRFIKKTRNSINRTMVKKQSMKYSFIKGNTRTIYQMGKDSY